MRVSAGVRRDCYSLFIEIRRNSESADRSDGPQPARFLLPRCRIMVPYEVGENWLREGTIHIKAKNRVQRFPNELGVAIGLAFVRNCRSVGNPSRSPMVLECNDSCSSAEPEIRSM